MGERKTDGSLRSPQFSRVQKAKNASNLRKALRKRLLRRLPLFRKLACELAEVTLEAHLKPSTFIRLRAAGNLTVVEGRFPANCVLYGLEIFVAAAVIKGITCVVQSYNNKSNQAGISLHQSLVSGPAMEKWIMFVLTHTANFNPRGIFVGCSDHFTDECFQRAVHVEGSQRSIIPLPIPTIWQKKIQKKRDERYLILTQLK